MKKLVIVIASLLMCLSSFAQDQEGVVFLDLTFDQAVLRAKAEGKPIFLDCFTTWCGPCKQMNKTVFNQKEVGDLYNASFINIKFDMEKGEGITLSKRFNVTAYPTYLYIDPTTQTVIHRILGAAPMADFLTETQVVLSGNTLSAMGEKYAEGNREEGFVMQYINALVKAQEKDKYPAIITEFLNGKGKQMLKNQVYYDYLCSGVDSPYSDIFKFVIKNKKKIIKTYGDSYFEKGGEYLVWMQYPVTQIKQDESGKYSLAPGFMEDYVKYMNKSKVEKEVSRKIEYLTNIEVARLNQDWNEFLSLEEGCLGEIVVSDYELLQWAAMLTLQCQDKAARERQAAICQERLDIMDAKVAEERRNQPPLEPGAVRAINMMQLNGAYEAMIKRLLSE